MSWATRATDQAGPTTRASLRQLRLDRPSGTGNSSFTMGADDPQGSLVVPPMPKPDAINQIFATDFRASLVTPAPSDIAGLNSINSIFRKPKSCQPLSTPSALPGAVSRPRHAYSKDSVPDGSAEVPVVLDDDDMSDTTMLDADMLDVQDYPLPPTAPALDVHGTRHRATAAASMGSNNSHRLVNPGFKFPAGQSSRPHDHIRTDKSQYTSSTGFQRGGHRQQLFNTYQPYDSSISNGKAGGPGVNHAKRHQMDRAPAFSPGQATSRGEKRKAFHHPATAPMAPPGRRTASLAGRGGFQRQSMPSPAEHTEFDEMRQVYAMSVLSKLKKATYKAMVTGGNLHGSYEQWDSMLDVSFTEAAYLVCDNGWVPDLAH